MAIVDPWVYDRVRELDQAEYESLPDDRIRELEDQFEALRERIETEEDSFDDDQLSRLGINNFVRDEVQSRVESISDLPRNYTPSPDTLLVTDNHGILSAVTVNDVMRTGIETDALHVSNDAFLNGRVYAQQGIDLTGSLMHNGQDLTTTIQTLMDRVEHLENEVRSLREENGQDNS